MSRSLQLFIEKRIKEERLMECLNAFLDGGVEAIGLPMDGAKYFVQIQDHEDGFRCGLNISWSDDDLLNINERNLARSIAKAFKTTVLLEVNDESCQWCLVDRSGANYAVSIIQLNDGISVNQEASKKLLN